ncbi:MAG: hypothetical protein IJY39_04385 [Clostridia bacterium]|nr:hypothetical protein [Clostridia bacterium]
MYVIFSVLGIAITLLPLIIFCVVIPEAIAYSDESVIARDLTGNLYALPLCFTLMLSTMIPICIGISDKQPIFGNKKYKPKWSVPIIKTYPIFSKEFRQQVLSKKSTKSIIFSFFVIFLAFLLLSLTILSFGIYPRKVLNKQNEFQKYNSFNTLVRTDKIEDADELIIKIERSSRGRSYSIKLKFVFDGESYVIGSSFKDMSRKESLEYLLYLKSFFDEGEYTIKNDGRIASLIYDRNYTEEEAELIYQLFDYQQ